MRKCKLFLLASLTCLVLSVSPAYSQHVQILSDRDWIELGIDLLRKSIQEQDTLKIASVLADNVTVKDAGNKGKAELTQSFQAVFDNSSSRELKLEKPRFVRSDSPRQNSNFWDFDILNPQITIMEDSAIVECVLVLWAAPPDGITHGPGRKMINVLTFAMQNPIESTEKSKRVWKHTSKQSAHNSQNSRRFWQLASFDKILDFLEKEITYSTKEKEQSGASR